MKALQILWNNTLLKQPKTDSWTAMRVGQHYNNYRLPSKHKQTSKQTDLMLFTLVESK